MADETPKTPPSAQQALESLGDKVESLPKELSDAQRVKACKRMLRLEGKQAEADALKHWELVNKVNGILSEEAAKPESERPIITMLKHEKPEAYRLMVEESCCDHSIDILSGGKKKPKPFTVTAGHKHQHGPRVDAVFQALAEDTTVAIPPDYVEAAKAAHRLHVRNRHAGKTLTVPAYTPSVSSSSGGSTGTSDGGHTCGSGCSHGGEAPATSASSGGLHYHGDTPCPHTHKTGGACPHAPPEPHLPSPKSNAAVWVTAAIGAACVGAYLINEYGKEPDKKKSISKAPWQERTERHAMPQARTL